MSQHDEHPEDYVEWSPPAWAPAKPKPSVESEGTSTRKEQDVARGGRNPGDSEASDPGNHTGNVAQAVPGHPCPPAPSSGGVAPLSTAGREELRFPVARLRMLAMGARHQYTGPSDNMADDALHALIAADIGSVCNALESALQPLDVEEVARVIREHRHGEPWSWSCSCGWRASRDFVNGQPVSGRDEWNTHLAEVIVSHFGKEKA